MIDGYMDKLSVIPATWVQEIRNRLQPFVGASVDRLIVPNAPVMEPVIDDAHGSLKRGASYRLHLINESKTFETEL